MPFRAGSAAVAELDKRREASLAATAATQFSSRRNVSGRCAGSAVFADASGDSTYNIREMQAEASSRGGC